MEEDDRFLLQEAGAAAALKELRALAPECARFGLELSEPEMEELAAERGRALRAAGRVEFGGGALPALMRAFCASPYVSRRTWAGTLAALQEVFYYFKSEAGERLSDDELIGAMQTVFDTRAHGSVEYLAGTSLEGLCREARSGREQAGRSAGASLGEPDEDPGGEDGGAEPQEDWENE